MLAFFTIAQGEVQQHDGVSAVDLVAGDYRLSIRISGVSLFKKGVNDPVFNQEINLSGKEEPKKKEEVKNDIQSNGETKQQGGLF